MKGKSSEEYPDDLLSISELNNRLEEMQDFRKWMIHFFPETFPEGEKTDFSLVIEEAKRLIITHINFKYLMEG